MVSPKEKDYDFDLIFKKIENKYVSSNTMILYNKVYDKIKRKYIKIYIKNE